MNNFLKKRKCICTGIFLIGCILSSIIFLLSCKKEQNTEKNEPSTNPIADFLIKQVSSDDPFTFKFVNNSANFDAVYWQFGDDSTSYAVEPIHTFLSTGEYTVSMLTTDESSRWAKMQYVITITADSLMDITTTKIGGTKMKLELVTDIDVDSCFWYKEVGNKYIAIDTAKSIDEDFPVGALDSYMVKIKTPKGTVAEIERLVCDQGIVNDITSEGIFSVSAENTSGADASEGSLKLIDNDITTKFLLYDFDTLSVDFQYFDPVVLGAYTFVTGNDAPGRDPKDWVVMGSNDGVMWETIDERVDQTFAERRMSVAYIIPKRKPYYYYRFIVKSVKSGTLFQMSELRLLKFPE